MAIKTKTATREDQRGVLVELSLFPGFQGVQATGVVIILILILILMPIPSPPIHPQYNHAVLDIE